MTNEEEKILGEEEVTLEEAAEEAEELQEEDKTETPEEESAEEARDIREEIRELRQEVEQLRGGLRGVGHPEMIQTHLDNFLAKIAGETPVDDKPRNSTEFWLNEIAKGNVLNISGKQYKIVACVLRNVSGTWQQIGGDHAPINIDSITQTDSFVQVHYNFTAKNVVSFVACPDEDFGSLGYFIGASVGVDVANIEINQQICAGGYIAWNGTGFDRNGDVLSATVDSNGIITINHKSTGNSFGRSVSGRDGKILVSVTRAGATADTVIVKDYSGTDITTPTTDFKIFWSNSGSPELVNPKDANTSGNIWCFGIMEV